MGYLIVLRCEAEYANQRLVEVGSILVSLKSQPHHQVEQHR